MVYHFLFVCACGMHIISHMYKLYKVQFSSKTYGLPVVLGWTGTVTKLGDYMSPLWHSLSLQIYMDSFLTVAKPTSLDRPDDGNTLHGEIAWAVFFFFFFFFCNGC